MLSAIGLTGLQSAAADTSGFGTVDPTSLGFIIVFSIMGLWILGIVILFTKLARKFTFGDWSREKNPYEEETFAMPRGVLRGILTLSLLVLLVLLEMLNISVDGGLIGKMEGVTTAFQMVIAFYFGSKVMHHVTTADKKKVEAIAGQPAYDSEEAQG